MQDKGDITRSSNVLLGVGALTLPSAVFLLGFLLRSTIPSSVVIQSQWLFDAIGVAIIGGGLLSILTSPVVVLLTARLRHRVSAGAKLGLYLLTAIAVFPLAAVALYVLGLSAL